MKKLILIPMLFLGLMAAHTTYAQKPAAAVDSLLTRLHLEQGFDGNVLIADHGHIIYQRSFGLANAANGQPLTKDNLFNLASVSKIFTAIAVMQLVEAGKLRLTDNLQTFFPDMLYAPITIYNLLNHTSGLIDFEADPVRNALSSHPDNAEIERVFAKVHLPARFPPGADWGYSNTNYLLLALIVEKVSGLSYPEYIKQHIFIPAKMKRSFVLFKNIPPTDQRQVTHLYYYPDILALHPANVDSIPMARAANALSENSYGDGGVFSTTGDLFRFHQALQEGRLLDRKSQAIMYAPVILRGNKNYEVGNANPDYSSGYGLGWMVARDSSRGKVVWHSGADPGVLTFLMRNIDRDQCVIVLNNNWYRGTYHLGGSLMNMLNNRPMQLMALSLARMIGQEYSLHGAAAALTLLSSLKNDKGYHIGFLEMNELGYDLLAKNDTQTAIAVLRVNTETYPKSGDVWDSLAEAYYKAGDKESAVADYQKSIQLDPHNENGKKMLTKIKAEIDKGGLKN
jgi:CubicO group peptidase (beta-lactamase class C family)